MIGLITLKYPAGEMTIDFAAFLKTHRYGKTYVKKLLKLSNAENRADMLDVLNGLMLETKAECKKVANDAQAKIDAVDNMVLTAAENEALKNKIRSERDKKHKKLINVYRKMTVLKGVIQDVKV